METLSAKTPEKKSWILEKALTLALCGTLTLWNMSCGHKTEKDVMEQQKKVETLSFQISHYINARKWFVEKYNTLLKYPKTEANKAQIYESLSQLYEIIAEYDEKIADLAEDKLDAEVDLNDYIAEAGSRILPSNPIDPNKRDFLLTIQ